MSDNKHYRGKIDRIRVAFGQEYEVDYFVDHYIQSRGYTITTANREALHGHLDAYSRSHPGVVMRDELTAWLNEIIQQKQNGR
jgi:hypothetical protein